MEWHDRFVGLLAQLFQIEHLSCPAGRSFGAGHPVSAADLLETAIPREEMEHYPEVLVDDWGAQHVLDQSFGLETLLEFELSRIEGLSEVVQYSLLDLDGDCVFVARKVHGRPFEFLIAVERKALDTLIPATILSLFAAESAFGEPTHDVQLPAAIVNYRPDLLSEEILMRGFALMLDACSGRGLAAWEDLADEIGASASASRPEMLNAFFADTYSESEKW